MCFIWEESNLYRFVYYKMRVVFKKTDGTIKNRQFRDPGKFGHTKDKTKTKKNKQMIKKKSTNKKEKKTKIKTKTKKATTHKTKKMSNTDPTKKPGDITES